MQPTADKRDNVLTGLMPRIVRYIWFPLLVGCLGAQSPPADKTEKIVIERAKAVFVSSLDRSLPKITLEYFLNYESKGAAIHWEMNDCGEQSGNPETDRGRDFPVCVEADFDVERRAVSVLIGMGTVDKGITGTPSVFSITVSDVNGIRSIKRLGDLPAELHRPLPRPPRNLQPIADGL